MNEVDELMQIMRTLRTSQIRKQLEHDFNSDPNEVASYYKDRFFMVRDFFKDAKEQML